MEYLMEHSGWGLVVCLAILSILLFAVASWARRKSDAKDAEREKLLTAAENMMPELDEIISHLYKGKQEIALYKLLSLRNDLETLRLNKQD